MHPSRAYGNIEVYSPDGILMFRANEDKLRFYKRNNLVEIKEDGKHILLFNPNGLGHFDRNRELLSPRENKCVRCGEEDVFQLTRHHVVPTRFRKYFPEFLKSNNHRYVVFLCRECHDEYGRYEDEFNDILAQELGIKTLKQCNDENYVIKRILTGIADTLLFKENIPETRIIELQNKFLEKSGMEPTLQNLHKCRKWKYDPKLPGSDFGRLVVDAVGNLYEFQQRWLEHFVEKMEPRYLPEDLKILLPR